jgi:hypothetical protein
MFTTSGTHPWTFVFFLINPKRLHAVIGHIIYKTNIITEESNYYIYHCLIMDFLFANDRGQYGNEIVSTWMVIMKVITETRCAHWI